MANDTFTIVVRSHNWNKQCYDQTIEKVRKLLDAGVVDFSIERVSAVDDRNGQTKKKGTP